MAETYSFTIQKEDPQSNWKHAISDFSCDSTILQLQQKIEHITGVPVDCQEC